MDEAMGTLEQREAHAAGDRRYGLLQAALLALRAGPLLILVILVAIVAATTPVFRTSDNLGTDYRSVLTDTRVLVATAGTSITASTTDLTRWDGDVPYPLHNVGHTFQSTNGLFDGVQQQVFRQTQSVLTAEDCVVNVRFTITPLGN